MYIITLFYVLQRTSLKTIKPYFLSYGLLHITHILTNKIRETHSHPVTKMCTYPTWIILTDFPIFFSLFIELRIKYEIFFAHNPVGQWCILFFKDGWRSGKESLSLCKIDHLSFHPATSQDVLAWSREWTNIWAWRFLTLDLACPSVNYYDLSAAYVYAHWSSLDRKYFLW